MSDELSNAIIKKEHQVTKASFIAVLSFVLLYLPALSIGMFYPLKPTNEGLAGLHVAGYILSWSSTFINTCIYVFSNSLYNSAFEETFGFSIRSKKNHSNELPSKTIAYGLKIETPKPNRRTRNPTPDTVCYSDDQY